MRSAVSRSAGAAESRRLSRAPDYPFSLPETGRKNHPLKDDFSYRQTKFSRAQSENAQSDDSKLCVLPDTLAQLSAPAARAAKADSAVSYDRRGRDIHYNVCSGPCAARKLPAARMKNAAPFGAARRELPFHSLPPEEADGKAGADGGRGQHDRGARRSPDPLPQPITLRTVFYRAGAGGLSTVSAVFRRSGDQKTADAFRPGGVCTRAQMAAFLYRALAGPDIGRKLRKFAEMRGNTAEGPQGPSPFVRDMYVAVFGLPRFLHSSKGRRTAPDEAWAALRRERTENGPRPGSGQAIPVEPRSGEGGPRTAGKYPLVLRRTRGIIRKT